MLLDGVVAAHVQPHPRWGQRMEAPGGRRRVRQVDEMAAAGEDVVLEVDLAFFGGL